MALAKPEAIFLHCLPAKRGEEVAAAVIDGPQSVVWQQSANRMPTEEALLLALTRGFERPGSRTMRIVVALGGNALLRRGEPAEAATQRAHVLEAASALAALAADDELVITHGNGPQVGLLALEADAYKAVAPVSARHPRRREPGHDRLPARPGARRRAARARGRRAADAGAGRPRRPGLRLPDEADRPGLLASRRRDELAAEPRLDGRPRRRATSAASSPRPSRRAIVELAGDRATRRRGRARRLRRRRRDSRRRRRRTLCAASRR